MLEQFCRGSHGCGVTETADDVLLACPAYEDPRNRVRQARIKYHARFEVKM